MKDFVRTLFGTLYDYCDDHTPTLEDTAIESHYETLKEAYNDNSSLSKIGCRRHLVYNSRHDYNLLSGSFKEVQRACHDHVECLDYKSSDTSHKSLNNTFCRINAERYFDSLKDD